MLTADLAQSWRRGGRVVPRYIDPADPDYLRDAADLVALFRAHEGRRRRELDEALEDYVGTGTDYKILRGLIKLLTDRCDFETVSHKDPAEVRRVLFLKVGPHHPLTGDDPARAEVLKEAAGELECPPDVLLAELYADLPENQKLTAFKNLAPAELLDLYNVAQAQALLYRCVEMRLWVEPQPAAGYRELFGAIKAYRLLHTVRGTSSRGYEVRLDGPVSLFQRSQKYGVQMAVFLPAVLLCKGWRMRAEIQQPGEGGTAHYELDSRQTKLRSHYFSAEPYENPSVEEFAQAWARRESDWTLERSREVIDLGESAFTPDFVLTRAGGEKVYLEVLGFWTPRSLERRLAEFAHAGFKNFILAAWDELRGSRDPVTRVPPQTVIYKGKLNPVVVERAADESACAAAPSRPTAA